MGSPADAKYGMTRAQLAQAIKKLQKKGVKGFGIHSFLASNTMGNEYYPKLAKIIFEAMVELYEETGAKFIFANLSGDRSALSPNQEERYLCHCGGVKKAYEETKSGIKDIALYTELGRYMLAPMGI